MRMYLLRNIYTHQSTIGDLIINHEVFCHTLEDVVRAANAPKVPGETAIPSGLYQVLITYSPRFKRLMPVLINVPRFEGVRIHGGNTAKHTEGCIIVAKTIVSNTVVQGSMEKDLTALLQNHPETNYIEIIDTFPYIGTN